MATQISRQAYVTWQALMAAERWLTVSEISEQTEVPARSVRGYVRDWTDRKLLEERRTFPFCYRIAERVDKAHVTRMQEAGEVFAAEHGRV